VRSNGHGRAEGSYDPMARMGVTVVRSHQAVPMKKLEEMLLAEARKQGKPYGLVIVDVTGGDTNTGADGYQAFRGSPQLVYRVDAKTGARTLVRGVEMVGTPLSSINKIVATSDTVDGPYQWVKSFRPLGHESRDIGQFIDDENTAVAAGNNAIMQYTFIGKT
jgi:hypothetical protein